MGAWYEGYEEYGDYGDSGYVTTRPGTPPAGFPYVYNALTLFLISVNPNAAPRRRPDMRATVDIPAAKSFGLICKKELTMFQSKKTISTLVGAIVVALTITSAANAQQGSFGGQYTGVGEAAGAVLMLAQGGPQVAGGLQVDGAMYRIEASVSGTQAYGFVVDPASGTTSPLGLSLNGGELYVFLPQAASESAKVYRFQRGSGGAIASVDRRARRRERAKRVLAGVALVAVTAAAAANSSAQTSGGSSSGASSSQRGSANSDVPDHVALGLPDPDGDVRGYNARTNTIEPETIGGGVSYDGY